MPTISISSFPLHKENSMKPILFLSLTAAFLFGAGVATSINNIE
jgi:hypothetical protein